MRPRPRRPNPPLSPPGGPERKSLLRVPFVRRCQIEFSDGKTRSAFIANINEYGAYLADDEMPAVGQGMAMRFRTPGSEGEVTATGVVAWLNTRQQHAVHSLPPGYGVRFDPLREPARARVLGVVKAYLKHHPRG